MRAAVIGLGFVGNAVVDLLLKHKHQVYGYDVDQKKRSDRLTDFNKGMHQCDVIFICVPTKLKGSEPDFSNLQAACLKIESEMKKKHVKKKPLVVVESTLAVGWTEKIQNRLKYCDVAYSPERINPGFNVQIDTCPKLVSGVYESTSKRVQNLYNRLGVKTILTSVKAAEISKLFENTFRAVNCALANELKEICNFNQVNVYEVLKAAQSKPFGFSRFDPGPGIGGDCIPVSAQYLSKAFTKKNSIIKTAVNSEKQQVDFICNKILKNIPADSVKAGIYLVGLGYKSGQALWSPLTDKLVKRLLSFSNLLGFYDPYSDIPNSRFKRMSDLKFMLKSFITVILISPEWSDSLIEAFVKRPSKRRHDLTVISAREVPDSVQQSLGKKLIYV